MKRMKYNRNNMRPIAAIACGSAASILLGVLLASAAAYMMLSGILQEQHMQLVTLMMQFVSVLAGGGLARVLSNKKAVWVPLSVVSVQMLFLLAAHILMIDAPLAITWTTIISTLSASALLVMTSGFGGRKGKFKYHKM